MRDERGHRLTASEVESVEQLLPEQVWITEVMTPALYTGNKRKLGEVVCRTTATEADIRGGRTLVFAWLAGVRWQGVLLTNGPAQWGLEGHVPLARGVPAKECVLEW